MKTKKSNCLVILDAGHCKSTPGKCSPDKRILEYKYVREIVSMVEAELDKLGIPHWNCHPEEDFVYKTKGNYSNLDYRDLALRVDRINLKYQEMRKNGGDAFLVSVHCNAASNGNWTNARGWSAWTSKGQTRGDKVADCLYREAHKILDPEHILIREDWSDKDPDWESNFYILYRTSCPATLVENFFMDNKADVEFLLSDDGKKKIVDILVNGIVAYLNE